MSHENLDVHFELQRKFIQILYKNYHFLNDQKTIHYMEWYRQFNQNIQKNTINKICKPLIHNHLDNIF